MIEMVSWFYDINEWLIQKDTRAAWAALISGAVLCFLGGLALIGVAYYYYAPSASCSLNVFFITWSIVIGFATVGLLFIPDRLEVAGLMTSGSIFLYASYLLISALSSEPENSCVKATGVGEKWIQIVGFFLAIGAVSYSTLALGTSHIFTSGGGEEGSAQLPYRPDFFHLVYALASMYMAMLYTNWEISSNTTQFELSKGWISTWVKMGSKWFCEALYLWTVVAPAVCRGRDFT
eukprot:jgi/Chrzof1/7756/Cz02g35180.t1